MFKRKLTVIFFLLVIFSVESLHSAGIGEEQDDSIQIAFSFGAEWLELYQAMEDMVLRAAAESGSRMDFQFWYADGNLEKESLNIDKAIASKPDVLVLMPLSAEKILKHIEHAQVRKIPVIIYNRMQKSDSYIQPEIFIGMDTFNQAYTTAVGLFKLMRQDGITAKPVLILGDFRDNNAINRRAGFKKAAEDFGVEFVSEIETDWNAKKAAEGLDSVLKDNPEVNSILMSSDFMITEVKKVLSGVNRWAPYGEREHIYLGAQDTFSVAVPLIREGYIDVDTAFDVWPMSTTLVQVISTLASGQSPSQNVFLIPGRVITQNNIDSMNDLWSIELE